MEILDIISLSIGVIGFIFGIFQYRSNIRTKALLKGQFTTILDRMRALVPSEEQLDEILKDCDDKKINKWSWFYHKGICDIYVLTVSYYLTFEKRFTYKHLENKTRNDQFFSRWEEERWRYLISVRDENKGKPLPNLIIKDEENQPPRSNSG